MKRRSLVSASAAALCIAAPLAFAQGPPETKAPPVPPGAAGPPPPERMESRSGGDGARQDAGRSADDRGAREARDERRPASEGSSDGDRTQNQARDDKAPDNKSGNKSDSKTGSKSDDRGDSGDKGRSDSAAKDRSDDDKDRPAGEQARDEDRRDTRDSDRSDRSGTEARDAAQSGDRKAADAVRSDVDEAKRAKVRDAAFRGDVKRATNVDVDVNIGVRLPRSVEIYAVPDEIIAIAPAYRGYHYVVIDDAYCIVDPETYEIVDVIHRGGPKQASGGGSSIRLDLTNAQIDVIRRGIGGDQRSFDYDGDLEVGVALPGEISFETFPDLVVREVPEVRSYRYALIEDEIAIVSPDGPEVVFVIGD